MGYITKANRKVAMAACLLLSYKFNEKDTGKNDIDIFQNNQQTSNVSDFSGTVSYLDETAMDSSVTSNNIVNSSKGIPPSITMNMSISGHSSVLSVSDQTVAISQPPKWSKFKNKLPLLLNFIDETWCLSPKQVFAAEFGVYRNLEFSLHLPPYEVTPHFNNLLSLQEEMSMKEYLGDSMLLEFQKSLQIFAKDYKCDRKIKRLQ